MKTSTSSSRSSYYKIKETLEDYDGDSYEDEQAHSKLTAPADFHGPTSERYCTDILCLFFLVISWLILTGLGVYAIHNGDYRHILFPLDYQGNICGTQFENVDMSDYPYLMYVNSYTGGVCVSECPSLKGEVEDDLTDMQTLITYGGIFQGPQAQIEADVIRVSPHYSSSSSFKEDSNHSASTNTDVFQCTMETCFGVQSDSSMTIDSNLTSTTTIEIAKSWMSEGINEGYGYAYYVGESYPLFQRCYLTQEAENQIAEYVGQDPVAYFPWAATASSESQQFFTNLWGDLWEARFYILGFGFGVSLVLSLFYMSLLRIPCLLTSVVWGSILAVIAIFAGIGYYAYTAATTWSQMDQPPVRNDQIDYTFYASYVCWAISGLLLLMTIFMRSSVQLAITCVQHGGAAINSMVFLLLVPLLQVCGFMAFWITWMWFGVHLASLGNIELATYPIPASDLEVTIRAYSYDDFTEYCGWYFLFCFFWTAAFIQSLGQLMVSLSVSSWYFTVDKSTVNSCTVVKSMGITIRYHLGTCAYGSLLVAIVQLIRAIIVRFQKRVAQFTSKSLAQCLFCCCQCCLCCVEKCLKFINKNAYVQTAIFGTPFAESGRAAFFLILRNAGSVGALSFVSGGVMWIGKVFISTLTTSCAYYFMTEYMQLSLHSFAVPCLTIFVLSYFVAGMFMGVFELSILTVLHCYVADLEMFDGRARYADGSLKEWIEERQSAQEGSSVVISSMKR